MWEEKTDERNSSDYHQKVCPCFLLKVHILLLLLLFISGQYLGVCLYKRDDTVPDTLQYTADVCVIK